MQFGLSVNKIKDLIGGGNVVASVDESYIDVNNVIKTDTPSANNSSSEQTKTYNIQEDCYIYFECFGVSSSYDVKIYAYINDVMVYKCFNLKADYTERQSQIFKVKKGDKFKVAYSGGGYTLTMYGMSKQITNYVPEDALGYEGMSNWELWGSVTGTDTINLPTDFEEIEVVSISNYVTGGTGYKATYKSSFTKAQFNNIVSVGCLIDGVGISSLNNYAYWVITNTTLKILEMFVSNKKVTQEAPTYVTTYVYYKKKNGVTVDVNDLGEWKLHNTGTESSVYLGDILENAKELLIVMDYSHAMSTVYLTKQDIEVLKNATANKYFYFHMNTSTGVIGVVYRYNTKNLEYTSPNTSFKIYTR